MEKATFKYPVNRLGGHLPNRISAPPDTRSYNDAVIHGFNDFMTRCRHSSLIRRTISPQHRVRDDPPAHIITEADGATVQSAYKQKKKSSTIKTDNSMSNEIFVAFATQKGGIGKSTVTALVANSLHIV